MAKINTLLFDLDGTLVDSVPDLAASVNFALGTIDHPSREQAEIRQWVGNGVDRLLHRAITASSDGVADAQLHQRAVQGFEFWYRDHYADQSRLYEGVTELLAALQLRGFKMACVTNKPHPFTLPLLTKFAIDHYFQAVIGGDSTATRKPDPLPLLTALDQLDSTANESVMIGDSINDFLAGQRSGMATIMVSWGYSQGIDLDNLGADGLVQQIGQLLPLIDTLGGPE